MIYPSSLLLMESSFFPEHVFSWRYLSPCRYYKIIHSTACSHRTMAMAFPQPFSQSTANKGHLMFKPSQSFLKVYWFLPFCLEPWCQQNLDCQNLFSVCCSIITVVITYKYWHFFLFFFSEDNIYIFSALFPLCIWKISLYFSETFTIGKKSS